MAQSDQPGKRSFAPVVRAPRLSDVVAEQLLESIYSAGLKPGDRLPSERELSEQFAVSRTVIREATRSLAAKAVIDVRPGAGLTVAAIEPSDVAATMNLYVRGTEIPYEKIHEVRSMIEIHVTGLAAQRATDDDIELLRDVHVQFGKKLAARDLEGASEADVDFHRTLAKLTHNELYLVMLDSIGDLLLEIRRETMNIRGRPAKGVRAHEEIFEHVAARDVEEAQQAMKEHLDESFQAWVRLGRPVSWRRESPAGD